MKSIALVVSTALSLSLAAWTQPINTLSNSKSALTGRVNGPADVMRRVESNSSYTDRILFRGRERAELTIEGDGDCDLDLYVYNDDGELVAKDDDDTDYCLVNWIPSYTQSYRIVVKNRGGVYANYRLKSN